MSRCFLTGIEGYFLKPVFYLVRISLAPDATFDYSDMMSVKRHHQLSGCGGDTLRSRAPQGETITLNLAS